MIYFTQHFTTREAADAYAVAYYNDYHPMGYGTDIRIVELREAVKAEDGSDLKFAAHVTRGESCD